MSDIWYPAWKANIDDKPVDIHRINWSLRGIEVPKGTHTITLQYVSEAYSTGSTITYSGLGLTAIAIAIGLFLQRKRNLLS